MRGERTDRQTGRHVDDRDSIHAPSQGQSRLDGSCVSPLSSAHRNPILRGAHSEQPMGLCYAARHGVQPKEMAPDGEEDSGICHLTWTSLLT